MTVDEAVQEFAVAIHKDAGTWSLDECEQFCRQFLDRVSGGFTRRTTKMSNEQWEPFKDCTPECAVPVPCPECGRDLPPLGRAVPLEMYMPSCCEQWRYGPTNTRHIWDESELPAAGRPTT